MKSSMVDKTFGLATFLLLICFSAASSAQVNFIKETKDRPELVVFIHGLGGDSVETWTNANGFYFPEKLAKDPAMEKFDVATFQYASDCQNVTPFEAGEILLRELKDRRRYRKYHFVAHSLGGIVARQFAFMNHAGLEIKTMQLLGTPNFGVESDLLIDVKCRLQGKSRLSSLAAGRGTVLDKFNDDWRDKLEQDDGQKSFRHLSGYEVPPRYYPWIVQKQSAIVFSSSTRAFDQTGHTGLSKPTSEQDPIYLWVLGGLINSEINHPKRSTTHSEVKNEIRSRELDRILQTLARRSEPRAKDLARLIGDRSFDRARLAFAKTSDFSASDGNIFSGLLYDLAGDYINSLKSYLRAAEMVGAKSLRPLIEETVLRQNNRFLDSPGPQPDKKIDPDLEEKIRRIIQEDSPKFAVQFESRCTSTVPA